MQRSWVLTCLTNFLIAALLGLFLRYMFVNPLDGFNFRFLTHAHSHTAMLGWVYLMLYSLIVWRFIPKPRKIYKRLFWMTEFAVIGMVLSFPFEGYAAVSISFSTLHIFCSYYFARLVWKDEAENELPERKLLKTSLLFMLLSTLGVWCLGPAVAMTGAGSPFYNIAIQFFLHFQFNGWFLLAVLAIFFKTLNKTGLTMKQKEFKKFYYSHHCRDHFEPRPAGGLVCATSHAADFEWHGRHPSTCSALFFPENNQASMGSSSEARFHPLPGSCSVLHC